MSDYLSPLVALAEIQDKPIYHAARIRVHM